MEDVGDHHHDRGWEQLAPRLRARLESTREAFPFAAAATAPAVVVPLSLPGTTTAAGRGERQSPGLAELRRRAEEVEEEP